MGESLAAAVDVLFDCLSIGPDFAGYIVEPCCNSGAIATRIAERCPLADVRGIDLSKEAIALARARSVTTIGWESSDWLTWQRDGAADLIVSKPPLRLAEKVLAKSFDVLNRTGRAALLLPIDFIALRTESKCRRLADYAWHVWDVSGRCPRHVVMG